MDPLSWRMVGDYRALESDMNKKVYWMEISGGDGYRNTFYFTSAHNRKVALEKAKWAAPDATIKLGHGTEFPAATIKRMVEQGLTSPYRKRRDNGKGLHDV